MLDMRRLHDTNISTDEEIPLRLYLQTRPFVFKDPATELIIGPAVEKPESVKLSVEHILMTNKTFSEKIKVRLSTVK